MRSLGLLIILALAAFFIYPLAAQRTSSECTALSRRMAPATAAPANSAGTPLAARNAASRALPRWPTPVGCAWLYWHSVFNLPS